MSEVPAIYIKGSQSPLKLHQRLAEMEKANPAIDHDRLLNASDSNGDRVITDAEADKALRNLDRYFSSNIQQLSKEDIEKRVQHFETASFVHFQPAKDPVSGIEKYGEVFNISVNGEPYQILLVQKHKLDEAKIDLPTIFANQQKKDFDLRGEYITDVTDAQANEILGAIVKDNPALKDKLGFFSMGETTDEGPSRDIFRMLDKTKIAKKFGIEGTYLLSRRMTKQKFLITTSKPYERSTEIVPYNPNYKTEPVPGQSGTSSRCAVMFGILVKTTAK
jgi:hypothetical protein